MYCNIDFGKKIYTFEIPKDSQSCQSLRPVGCILQCLLPIPTHTHTHAQKDHWILYFIVNPNIQNQTLVTNHYITTIRMYRLVLANLSWGGYSDWFHTGMLHLRSGSLTLSHTKFWKIGTLSHTKFHKLAPFHIP